MNLTDYMVELDGTVYVHELLVVCLILAAAWIPFILSRLSRLLQPLAYSLAKLIRKFL